MTEQKTGPTIPYELMLDQWNPFQYFFFKFFNLNSYTEIIEKENSDATIKEMCLQH